ncbi:MAG: zinc-dependent peptidase [Bacteroidota bacterium]
MASRILALPFVVVGLVSLYAAWEISESYSLYIIPCVVAIALIFVFSPQIDWWWYQRRPPKLDDRLVALIQQYPFFQTLSTEEKKKFLVRTALFTFSTDFKSQSEDGVPTDIQTVVAACAVHLLFRKEKYLLPKFETVVVYPHPFPSPKYPEFEHVSEIYEEDGVLLFAADQLMYGFLQPFQYYNIGLHEYAHAYVVSNPGIAWPKVEESVWDSLEQISSMKKEAIDEWINRPDVEALLACIVHYLTFPERFAAILPELKTAFDDILQSK